MASDEKRETAAEVHDRNYSSKEKIDDIVAEIMRAVESMGDELPYVVSAGTMRRIAARIEAAAKRDAAIHAMTVEANERLREHLEIAIENDRRTAVGNTAAMRDALEAARSALERMINMGTDDLRAYNKVCAALAAPPRNCDRFATVKAAAIAFARERQDAPQPCPDFTFSAWLFAPAKKKEGGAS